MIALNTCGTTSIGRISVFILKTHVYHPTGANVQHKIVWRNKINFWQSSIRQNHYKMISASSHISWIKSFYCKALMILFQEHFKVKKKLRLFQAIRCLLKWNSVHYLLLLYENYNYLILKGHKQAFTSSGSTLRVCSLIFVIIKGNTWPRYHYCLTTN